MRRIALALLIAAGLGIRPCPAGRRASVTLGTWTARQPFTGRGGTIHYYLFTPKAAKPAGKYPLVVWLHGGLRSNGKGGPNMPTAAFYRDQHQRKRPCFVLRPVAIKGENWVSPRGAGTGSHLLPKRPAASVGLLMELLDRTVKRHPIDPNGVHLIGASMGGYGVWDVIARHPKRFASAIPICGGGDPTKALAIKHMRIWVFHAVNDPYVPVRGSRQMVAALMATTTGKPVVKQHADRIVRSSADGRIRYTEFRGGGHNAWDRALSDPQVIQWVLAPCRPATRPATRPASAPAAKP